MSTIEFDSFPAGRRTPGVYTEINEQPQQVSLSNRPVRVLVCGQKLSGGSATADTEVRVLSGNAAKSLFGQGSMLALMCAALLANAPSAQVWGLPVDDHGSATQGTQTITFSGTATSAGALELYVGGVGPVRMSIPVGMTATEAAAELDTQIGLSTKAADWPMTEGVASAVVTLTARNGGALPNDIDVHIVQTGGAGLSAAIAAGVTGADDPEIETALDNVAAEDFDLIVIGYDDTTNLGFLQADLATRLDPLQSKPALGVAATVDTLSNSTTLADNYKTFGWLTLAALQTPTWSPVVAAAYAGVIASEDHPARPLNGLALDGVRAPWVLTNRWTKTETESALWAGVTPLKVGAGGAVQVERAITTKTETPGGAPTDAMLDISKPRTLARVAFEVRTMLTAKYPRALNTPARRNLMRKDVLGVLYLLEQAEMVERVDELADSVLVEVDGGDPTRNNFSIPVDIVDGAHILAARIDLTV